MTEGDVDDSANDTHDSDDKAPPPMPLTFLGSSADNGTRTITTLGMLFSGLPELIVSGAAPNHARAARILISATAHAINRLMAQADDADALGAALTAPGGMRLTLTPADASADSGIDPAPGSSPVEVHVARRGFESDDEEPTLLGVDPLPGSRGPFDERLRAACRLLGHDVPAADRADSMEAAMQAAHQLAVERMAQVKARFQAASSPGETLYVKMRAVQGEHGEYVWLHVEGWTGRELRTVVATPAPNVGLDAGQPLTITEDRVFDQLVTGPDGVLLPSATDLVAIDYGLDL